MGVYKGDRMDDLISRKWLMECVEEGWIKFDTQEDENKFIHLVRDIAPSAQPVDKDINVPVNDTISRAAAIDAMCELMHHWFGGDPKDEIREIKRELEKLPSAQPIDVQEAYYRGKIDGVKECTERLKKVTEEFANG